MVISKNRLDALASAFEAIARGLQRAKKAFHCRHAQGGQCGVGRGKQQARAVGVAWFSAGVQRFCTKHRNRSRWQSVSNQSGASCEVAFSCNGPDSNPFWRNFSGAGYYLACLSANAAESSKIGRRSARRDLESLALPFGSCESRRRAYANLFMGPDPNTNNGPFSWGRLSCISAV